MYVDQNTEQFGGYFRSVYSPQLWCYGTYREEKKKKGEIEINEISVRDWGWEKPWNVSRGAEGVQSCNVSLPQNSDIVNLSLNPAL